MIPRPMFSLAKITEHDFAQERPVLIVEFPGFKKGFNLNREVFCIGRHPSNYLVFEDKQVSRCHATIAWLKYQDNHGNWERAHWIIDGKGKKRRSRNGILINGIKKSTHRLNDGDIITIGKNIKITYLFVTNNTQNNNMLKTVYYL